MRYLYQGKDRPASVIFSELAKTFGVDKKVLGGVGKMIFAF